MTDGAAAANPDHGLLSDVEGLFGWLRDHGFALGVRDELRLYALRDALAEAGRSPTSLEALSRLVGPIVCRDPDAQARLPRLLGLWIGATGPVETVAGPTPLADAVVDHERGRRWSTWALALVALAVLAGAVVLWWLHPWSGAAPVATPAATAPEPVRAPTPVGLGLRWKVVLALTPLLAALAISLTRRRSAALERGLAPRDARTEALRIGVADSPLLRPAAVRLALGDLRRHRLAPGSAIDAPRTIAATLRSAGFIRLVTAQRPILPDYILLTDQAALDDHLGALADVLAARLKVEQIRFTRYEFRGDPRLLTHVRADGTRERASLDRVAADSGQARLLVLADIAGLWDPVRRRWRAWVEALAAFDGPVLLSPLPRARWGPRERELMAMGFMIIPATADGLKDLAARVRATTPGAPPRPPVDGADPLDTLLSEDPYRWTGEEPPEAAEMDELLARLSDQLGPGAYLHLCALAVFPTLHPRLSEAIGAALTLADGTPALTDEGFAAVARLPWLRRGRMPDWLRRALIESMDAADAERVRAVWTRALEPQPPGAARAVDLTLVRDSRTEAAVRRLLARLIRARATPSMSEALLLAFLEGRPLPPLGLAAPERLDRREPFAWPRLDRLDLALLVLAGATGTGLVLAGEGLLTLARSVALATPLMARVLLSPSAMAGAAAVKALLGERTPRLLRWLAPSLGVAALLASFGTAVTGDGRLAILQVMGALAATLYAILPGGLAAVLPEGIDRRRLFSGDQWPVTTLVLFAAFAAIAGSMGLALDGLLGEPTRWLDWRGPWAWPGVVLAVFVVSAAATTFFSRRLGLVVPGVLGIAGLAAAVAALSGAMAASAWALGGIFGYGREIGVGYELYLGYGLGSIFTTFYVLGRPDRSPGAPNRVIRSFIVVFSQTTLFAAALYWGDVAIWLPLVCLLPVSLFSTVYIVFGRAMSKPRTIIAFGGMVFVLFMYFFLISVDLPSKYSVAASCIVLWAVPAALMWPTLRWAAPGLWRDAPAIPRAEVYPDLWPLAFALLTVTWQVSPAITIDPTPLLLPLTVWLTIRRGWAGARGAVLFGAAPLILGLSAGPVATAGDPGLYIALVVIARLVADTHYAERWYLTERVRPWQIAFLLIALGCHLGLHVGGGPAIDVRWQMYALQDLFLVLVGLSLTPVWPLAGAIAGSALMAAVFILVGDMPIQGTASLNLDLIGAMALPSQVVTAAGMLLIGRMIRDRVEWSYFKVSGDLAGDINAWITSGELLSLGLILSLAQVSADQGRHWFPLISDLILIPLGVHAGVVHGARARIGAAFWSVGVLALAFGVPFQSAWIKIRPWSLAETLPAVLAAAASLEIAIRWRERQSPSRTAESPVSRFKAAA